MFLSFFRFFSTRISLALFHVFVFLYEQPVPCSFLHLPFSRYSVAVFFVEKPSISFGGGAATQLALSCHDVCCCITLWSIMFFAPTLRSKRSRAKKKSVPNYERRLFDFFFGRQIGWEQRRGGGKETFPTLPYPYPYFHFSLSTRFLLFLFVFVFCVKS